MMKVIIEISDEGFENYMVNTVKLTLENTNVGVKQIKYVSMDSLASALQLGLHHEDIHQVGKIPAGYYDAVLHHKSGGFGCNAILILPKKKQHIVYMDTAYEMELPTLVFGIQVKSCRLVSCRVYCTKDTEPNAATILYRFPLGNVSAMTGEVCWGANPIPRMECLKDLERIMSLFLAYPFNADHYSPNQNCAMENFNLRDLCEYVQQAGKFEEDKLLVPIDRNGYRTLGELSKSINVQKM